MGNGVAAVINMYVVYQPSESLKVPSRVIGSPSIVGLTIYYEIAINASDSTKRHRFKEL